MKSLLFSSRDNYTPLVSIKVQFTMMLLCLVGFGIFAQPPSLIWQDQKSRSIGRLISNTSDGNIVVCGTYGNDFSSDWVDIITVMYDTNGTEIWSQLYDDTSNGGIDEPFAMVIDTFDNIYIAGRTHLSNDGLPITPESLLLKYDKMGNLLWKKEYSDSLGVEGGARRMKLFQNRDIYITGYMDSISGSNTKTFLAKYDSSGHFNWAFIDTNSYETIGRDVEVDKNGNIYLIGTTACCTPGYKMSVTRFDSSGAIIWNTVLYDSAYIYAYTWEGAIDDSANIYLTAETQDTSFSTGYDCAVAKVDSAGIQKWFTVYNSNTNPQYWELSKDLIVSNNQIYVAGWISLPIGMNAFIIQLSQTGSINWWDTVANDNSGFVKLITDSMNVVAIGGGMNANGNEALLVSSYSLTGSENWRIQKEGNYIGNDLIRLDNSYYFTGYNTNIDPSTYDDSLFLFKYSEMLLNISVELSTEQKLNIYPNPVDESFAINLFHPFDKFFEVRIFNSGGKIVYEDLIKPFEIVSTKSWSSGVYLLQVKFENNIISKKFVKQ